MSEVSDKNIFVERKCFHYGNSLVIVFVMLYLLCPTNFNINKPDVINYKPFSGLN